MKIKLLTLISICGMLVGCAGNNPVACQSEVAKEFPEGEIQGIPGCNYKFLVRDTNSSIWYVENLNLNDSKISGKVLLFKGK